jgi:hypothetical protein
MLNSFDVLHFGAKAEKLVRIVAEKAFLIEGFEHQTF